MQIQQFLILWKVIDKVAEFCLNASLIVFRTKITFIAWLLSFTFKLIERCKMTSQILLNGFQTLQRIIEK